MVLQTPPAKRRQIDSPQTGSPKFFRLDYLWGSSTQKVARRPAPQSSPQQVEALAMVEAEVAEPAQGDPRAAEIPKRRAGRPKGSSDRAKAVPGVRKKRAEATAKAKLNLIEQLENTASQPEMSKTKAANAISQKYGISAGMVRSLRQAETKARLEQFVERRQVGVSSVRKAGVGLSKSKLISQSEGRRIPQTGKTLGRTDRCRAVWQQSALWAQAEEQHGHLISLQDLMRDYVHRLQTAIIQAEAETELSKERQADLAAWKQKVKTMQEKKKQRDRESQKLATRAGLRVRKCQQTQNLVRRSNCAALLSAGDSTTGPCSEQHSPKCNPASMCGIGQTGFTRGAPLRSHTQTKSQFGFGQDRANCSLAWSDWQPLRQPARSGGG